MDLKLQLLKAIRRSDLFSIQILATRILQSETEAELIEYVKKNSCNFCILTCNNPHCNLIPKGLLNEEFDD